MTISVFNLSFADQTAALLFFGFQPTTPLSAADNSHGGTYAGTSSAPRVTDDNTLVWCRDEETCKGFAHDGRGYNLFDGEPISDIALLEGFNLQGDRLVIVDQLDGGAEESRLTVIRPGRRVWFTGLALDDEERAVLFAHTADGQVLCLTTARERINRFALLADAILRQS